MATNQRYRARSKQTQTNLDQGVSTRDNLDSSSDYSDWLSQSAQQLTFSPPKQKKRRKRRTTNKNTKLKVEPSPQKKNSEWFVEFIPWRIPYFPQMGDDVVYFFQGHQMYLDTIKENSNYSASSSHEPWMKLNLKDHEFCKIIGIKYEISPMPVCCLKLVLIDQDGHLTGDSFSIKYHPIKDVHDFLILRQVFTNSLENKWKVGMKYQHMSVEHTWNFGVIQSIEPYQEKFPTSFFRCCRVRWDNGVIDTLSPWDLEPFDESDTPARSYSQMTVVKSIAAELKDVHKLMFQPRYQDWCMTDRGAICRKILRALDEVLKLPIAGDFIDPVPSPEVEYPVNLAIIKARLENRFYRYIASVKFDIRYLVKNAERSNPRRSIAVKYARILVDICLEIIKNIRMNVDVISYYHNFLASFNWSDSDMEVEEAEATAVASVSPTTTRSPVKKVRVEIEQTEQASSDCLLLRRDNDNLQEQPSTSADKSYISPRRTPKKDAENKKDEWKDRCRQVLMILWDCRESRLFRHPVDPLNCPDYEIMVPTPMYLQFIDAQLEVDNYRDPKQIYDDLRLVIANSRRYYDNRKTEIYRQTTKLSHIIDDLMKPILRSYTLSRNENLCQARCPRKSDVDEDEMDEMSSDCYDDIINDPHCEMTSQNQTATQESEVFSKVVDKLSQEFDDTNMQNDVANVDATNSVQVRDVEAGRNDKDNNGAVINVNEDNAQTSEDRDTGYEDHSNCSDSWDDALKSQLCLNKNVYRKT